ncbi:hypothetical protein AVEN_64849-1 [Araneus ventricosus]|uniref:Uncharacterized protein n=1 Tax=Araneus ventricosus TaxID=182803 RepID=A0A4Y2GN52_ARAVE|nr:hypothetical protein AVEN_64849-1 [Araneus ventricosus]
MPGLSRLSKSYGLIVKTECGRIVIIKRKVPYCVQNYFHHLHRQRKKMGSLSPVQKFEDIRLQCEKDWLPKLSESDRLDYEKFQAGLPFEDMFDFPHGQLEYGHYYTNYRQIFLQAYREFKEETGFKFKFSDRDIENYPLVKLEILGFDNRLYTQFYFIVENVRGLKRHTFFDSYSDMNLKSATKITSWIDDRLVYRGELVRLQDAYTRFVKQQEFKCDFKHLLCLDVSRLSLTMEMDNSCVFENRNNKATRKRKGHQQNVENKDEKTKMEDKSLFSWTDKDWLLNKIM